MPGRKSVCCAARLVSLCLVVLALGLPGAVREGTGVRESGPTGPVGAASFEVLVGQMGRAEAWYAIYGATLTGESTPARSGPPADVTPTLERIAPVSRPSLSVTGTLTPTLHLPLVMRSPELPMVERRALWITRYDWTRLDEAPVPETIDAMVAKIAAAGFNTVFFQVRAAGDAYYTPGLEPWAARLSAGPISETLGLDPGWDPLARMLTQGHAAGLEVHAYVNVYTAWQSPSSADQGQLWPPATTPPQMFDLFTYGPSYLEHPGEYALGYSWRQYLEGSGLAGPQPMPLAPGQYLWASPGVALVADHVTAVVQDIVARYPVDGVHLDLVRYAGPGYSYDPYSNAAAGEARTPARDQWQRDQVTALVQRLHDAVHDLRPAAEVSAAVWPYYLDAWGWGLTEGYTDYYQDSKGWLVSGAVDAIAPMLYGSVPDDLANWETLMRDFIDDAAGRPVYPGIGAHYDDFAAIAARILTARVAGAPGHVIFSYGALEARAYWDDLAGGPYQKPAILP